MLTKDKIAALVEQGQKEIKNGEGIDWEDFKMTFNEN